jgi:hypothetical protein
MGMAAPILVKPLYRELGLDRSQPLRVSLANTEFEAAASEVKDGDGGLIGLGFEQMFAPRRVEAMLPASLLRDRVLILDHARQRFALKRPEEFRPEGVAVPIALNPDTGLATVDVGVDGETHAFAIDAGSGYTWMRGDTLRNCLAAHPDWRRAEGAVGLANYNMIDFAFEKKGTVARLPQIAIGGATLSDVGVLGTGPVLGSFTDGIVGDLFWDSWQKAAPKPVVGWLGSNVLRNFRLAIDYPNRMSYWLAQRAYDAADLDQPGITLVRRDRRYYVGGIVRPAQGAALEGVMVGDELMGVEAIDAREASKGALLAALHGKPGETKLLTLLRDGASVKIDAPVLDLR